MESPSTQTEVTNEEEEFLPDPIWIQTKEENLPYLESLNIVVGEYTGTQYRNCRVPVWAATDMLDNWGELTFGYEDPENPPEKVFADTVIKYHGKKAVPMLIAMGFLKKPAAQKVTA